MTHRLIFLSLASLAVSTPHPHAAPATAELIHAEKDGLIAIEAEHFSRQTLTEKRAWHIIAPASLSTVSPDPDPSHSEDASSGRYIEALPDTRHSHSDTLVPGENFTDTPGQLATAYYKINVKTPGRYYVWARCYSTGTEDNGLHFGLNGQWPASGQRWQTTAKNGWHWDCKQRTAQTHSGVPMELYLDIPHAGDHELAISMREDGTELDKIILSHDKAYTPTGHGPSSELKSGKLPTAPTIVSAAPTVYSMPLKDFTTGSTGYDSDGNQWLALYPALAKHGKAQSAFPLASGRYNISLTAAGDTPSHAQHHLAINDAPTGTLHCQPTPNNSTATSLFTNIEVNTGDVITLNSSILEGEGRARITALTFTPADPKTTAANTAKPTAQTPKPTGPKLVEPRQADGNSAVTITGENRTWHKLTLTLLGPYAHEQDNTPNPFTDYALTVTFTHQSGSPSYRIPGYFAADGTAGTTSAVSGTHWRAHLSPDKPGRWDYTIAFHTGLHSALGSTTSTPLAPYHGKTGSFTIADTNKTGRDLRTHGRLQYVGQHHLQFAATKAYFLKAGTDSPETMLATVGIDNTIAHKPDKSKLKTWTAHEQDWKPGDPTLKNGQGKGLIGALNYLAAKGLNAYSFLTYNAGGDGDNVWPFTHRDDKLHYDCSKLDQWGLIFDHATTLGLYSHFKLQETENDDLQPGDKDTSADIPTAMDAGTLGPERKLYLREMIARYAHLLALNWNLGEENTQSPAVQQATAAYIAQLDPYQHLRVIHTYPQWQDKVYTKLTGKQSTLTGASLQNSWQHTHARTLKWIQESQKTGTPWVVANDEQGPANGGIPADPGYEGKPGHPEGKGKYTIDDTRKATLWGNLMAGGAGVEYYFGYALPQNDLACEDFRSRDLSWDYARHALTFFHEHHIPFHEMANANALLDNAKNENSRYCLAQPGQLYLIYLANGGRTEINLSGTDGIFSIHWYNPRTGGPLQTAVPTTITGGGTHALTAPDTLDWLALLRKQP